jgi:signal transduction histidine kinase
VRLSGALDDLSPAVGTAIYRIAQEAITNAIRHAEDASLVIVEVDRDGEHIRLAVRDDGRAATPDAMAGFGLLGMTERTALLGGSLRAGPAG